MTAVAVWDHQPGALELLEQRVKDGWQPTPSNLVKGPTVLGFAACLADGSCASVA